MKNLNRYGTIGAAVAGILCFTPILAIVLGSFGIGWITGYLEYIFIPVFLISLGLVGYSAFVKHKKGNIG